MAGYSGTPLWKKLGLQDGMSAQVINPPEDYHTVLLAGSPDVIWQTSGPGTFFTHLFTTSRAELDKVLRETLASMPRDGMIWVSWPKKASKRPTEVIDDDIRAACLPMGLVDVKVCAVSEIWSGLKLVIRKELR